MTDLPSDANFSLLLGEDDARMYHHPPGGAKVLIGEVNESEGSEELQWSVLRRRAFRLGSGKLATRVLLPESLVNYSICYAPGPTDRERSEQIRQGLIGRTGYNENVSQLVFDWCGDGDVLQVAAVALDSLQDAADFAESLGLNPVAYSAAPSPAKFAADPVFEFSKGRSDLPGAGGTGKRKRFGSSLARSLFGKAAKFRAAGTARKRGWEYASAALAKSAAALAIAVSAGAASAQTSPTAPGLSPEQAEAASVILYAPMQRPPVLAPAIMLRPASQPAADIVDAPAQSEDVPENPGIPALADGSIVAGDLPAPPGAFPADEPRLAAATPAEPVAPEAESVADIVALTAPARRPILEEPQAPPTAPRHRPGYLASLEPGARDAHDEFSTPITRPDVLMIGEGYSGTGRVTRDAARGPSFVPAASAASHATEKRILKRTREPLLIGVFGKEGSRIALVRLSDGSIARVSKGDPLDGGRVLAISGSSLTYSTNGSRRALAMP